MNFMAYLVNGLSLGSIYAIIALGYTMVYGIAKMLNFAHGDVIMIGGYICFTAMSATGSPWLGIILAVVVCTILGISIEKVAYAPLRKATNLAVLITAIGMSYLLQNLALLIFGANPKSFTSVVPFDPVRIGGFTIKAESIVTFFACIVIVICLVIFMKKSKTGTAMKAVAEDKGAAQLMGINVNKTISITFAIGSALAAVAGVLLCSYSPSLTPYTGAMPGIKAFTAAVFGGIGSIPGAFIGGLLLGVIEGFAKAYISSELADAIVFGVLIAVLVIKPTGIFGKQIHEKV